MTRWEKIPLWAAVSIIWLGTSFFLLGFLDHLFALATGTHPLGAIPVSACDLSHFCMNGESAVSITWVSPKTIYWTIAYDAAVILTLATALIVGTGVIRRISCGQPFHTATLRRMSTVAGTLMGGGALTFVLNNVAFGHVTRDTTVFQEATYPDGITITAEPDMLPGAIVFAGILALAFWAAFRQGTRMQEELDYVV
ncbi:hypothetical protein V3M44_05665 [Trueperella pyogenes]|uniref:hypothetical protein n=1 Tax=Trueperella pyogenes TaxID=1661 RepID=UPI00345CB9AA